METGSANDTLKVKPKKRGMFVMTMFAFSTRAIEKMYDIFSRIPFFWEIDAITCRATENSSYRSLLIDNINISIGARVLDIACGTGLNFNLIEKRIGPSGTITGLDNSEKTLRIAKSRIMHRRWTNVETVKIDAAVYQVEQKYDASICTFAIEIIPPYKETIETMIAVTKNKGRIGLIGFKYSQNPFLKTFNPVWKIVSLLGGGIDMNRNVARYLEKKLKKVFYQEVFGGFYYIAVFEKQ
jgi:demethylmenaquinone methyltransferase/2-methoxy-6-polyprenyl-1,4-benzoquinol methylase